VTERRYTDRQIYRRVLREARPYWGHLVAIFLITLLATPLALLQPVALKIAVDNVIGDKPLPGWLDAVVPEMLQGSSSGLLAFAVLLLLVVELLSQLQSVSKTLVRTYTSEQLTLQFRARLFRHAQRLALTYHDRKGTADANYRIQSDAAAVPAVAVDGVMPFVAAGCLLAAMVYVIARIEPALAAIALVVAPILAVLTWAYRRRLRVRHREVKNLESSALSVAQEVLTSLRVVKAFGQEEREERRFESQALLGMRARVRVAVVDKLFWIAIGLVTASGAAAVLFVGVRSVESGAITLGSLLLVMAYLSQLYVPLYTMITQVGALQSGLASAERVYTFLDQEPDVPQRPDARPFAHAKGAVEFHDVTFAYDAARPVLADVSFRVAPGSRVGIAGRTGAGKTTLVSLLTRFYDPTEGAIVLDGIDLRDYRLADLRNQFAIVLQEPVLFSTTIGENIAYGRPAANYDDIVAAAKAADVHDFITTLPDCYETLVGERGMSLSGGERQRIALARAFLKDAPILILDEATSSVDTKTEAAIMDAMERLMAGRTTFLIAHRLSTLEGCDLRLELRQGHVVTESDSTPRVARIEDHSSDGHTAAPGTRTHASLHRVRHLQMLPAVQAWEQLSGGRSAFTTVEVLKESSVSQAFRLGGGSPDLDVVAKRAPYETLESERTVYEHLLARLPVQPVRCLGHLPEAEGGFGWLFIEYVAAEPLRPTDERHLAALADYLATVHGGAALLPELDSLPSRNLSFFHGQLDAAFALIRLGLENTTMGHRDREVLMAHLELLETIKSGWDAIVAGMHGLPRTLVHCDVKSKNIRVVAGDGDPKLVLFDWEYCGVGCTAADLVGLARHPAILRRYSDRLGLQSTGMSVADVQRLADVGTVLHLILALAWAGEWLRHSQPNRALKYFVDYRDPLATALRRIGVTAGA
jgi:ATP-binding cassette subfamily B protein